MRTDQPDKQKHNTVLSETQNRVTEGLGAGLGCNPGGCLCGMGCEGKTPSKQRCEDLPLRIDVPHGAIRQKRSCGRPNDGVDRIPCGVEEWNLVDDELNGVKGGGEYKNRRGCNNIHRRR